MPALLLALSLLFAAAPRQFVLLTGADHGHYGSRNDLPASGWLGLFDDNKATPSLRSVGIATRPVKGPAGDGYEIDSKPNGAFLLFHGVPGIKEGAVEPALWNDPNAELTRAGGVVDLTLGKRSYRVRREKSGVFLETEGTRQQLMKLQEAAGDANVQILWAGDLDHDGRLDLIATLSGDYAALPRQVLLSSRAKAGELVHEVARFFDHSC